jgi:flavin reductase (DIM6/NTAB) family NADH-FMN oxidoreductase RutF
MTVLVFSPMCAITITGRQYEVNPNKKTEVIIMKKELEINPYLFPMPVLMIATYGDDDVIDVMNMAWGGICAENMVSLNIDEGHKTSENIKKRGAFTLSIADIPHIEAADFFGIATGNDMPDKFERSGLTAVKSEKVDAPIVQEFPLTLECKVVEDKNEVYGHHIIGEIVGVLADESVLDENGKVDPARLNAFVFDQFRYGYYAIGEKVGQAFHTGAPMMKK